MLSTLPTRHRLLLITGACIAAFALLIVGSALVIRSSGSSKTSTPSNHHLQTQQPTASGNPSVSPAQSVGVADDVRLLTAMPPVKPAASKAYPPTTATDRSQPDLYARAFATRLLTQNYAQPRSGLLAWVQAESAQSSEPRVVGLVPANLRSKLAAYSVTEAADGSAVPIPSAADWVAWQHKHAYTTVQVQKVIEPVKWSQAVAAGQISDPGVTEREVDSLVTTHWLQGKVKRSSTVSIALVMNLEGPPARAGYGFVTAVTYTQIPVN